MSLDGSGQVSPVSGFSLTQINVGLSLSDKFPVGEPFGLLDLVGPGISGIVSDIPVVGKVVSDVSIQVYAEPEIGGNVNLSFPAFQFQSAEFDGSVAITAEYEPDLYGAGQLRAYVGGTPSITFQVPSEPPGGFLKKAEFTVYAGLEVDVWVFSYSGEYTFLDLSYPSSGSNIAMQPLEKKHWVQVFRPDYASPRIVFRPNLRFGPEAFVANSGLAAANVVSEGQLPKLKAFRVMGRTAAGSSTPGTPEDKPQPLGGAASGVPAQVDLTLVTNAFPDNEPSLAAHGQELMLLYIADNGSTNNVNFTDINWTRYNGTNWSVPRAIQTNTEAEFEPQVKFDGNGDAIAVWDRVNDPHFSETNLNAMSADMEIVWSRWNHSSGTWSTPEAITANNYLDHAPLLCGPMADGSLLLVWTANTSDLLMGTNGAPSRILWTKWSPGGQSWTTPETLVDNVTYGLSQSFSGTSNLAVYAWSQDTVGTLTNLSDDQVFYCVWQDGVWSPPVAFTTNALGNRNARVAVSPAGIVNWVWQQGNNLVMSTNFSTNQNLVRSSSQTAGFADFAMTLGPSNNLFLLWQDMTTNGCHAHYMVYDPISATWTQDELLRNDPPLERSFAPVWDSAGNLTVAYNLVNIVTTNLSVTVTDGSEVTITNVPQPGDVDLVVTKRVLIKDLALLPGDFTLSGNNFLQGDAVALSANIRNLGDLGMTNVVASFYDGNPDSGGILISNVAVTGWLPGAGTNVVTALWVVPPGASNHVLYAEVDRTDAATEYTRPITRSP